MRKIYLTINLNVNDECFDNLNDCSKKNIREIFNQKQVNQKSFELEKIRGKVVAQEIIENETNLLIGFAVKSRYDLETILELIRDKKIRISCIFFDDGERKRAAINKYKKDYSLHSRWLDYSPEFVE